MHDTWLIGDIHGCKKTFLRLLESIGPSKSTQIVLLGDLINRGPNSAEVLDFIIETPLNIRSLLGNHDLAFIAHYHKIFKHHHPNDHYRDLSADFRAEGWINWLRNCPFYFEDPFCLAVHAGFYPFWSLEQNLFYAKELSVLLQSADYFKDLKRLWSQAHLCTPEISAQSFALNVFTRMRYVNSDKSLCLTTKGLAALAETKKKPWFDYWPLQRKKIVFGHWSALQGQTGREDILCLDTGCVWNESLSAYHTPTGKVIIQKSIESF